MTKLKFLIFAAGFYCIAFSASAIMLFFYETMTLLAGTGERVGEPRDDEACRIRSSGVAGVELTGLGMKRY